MSKLQIQNLHIAVEGKEIVHGVDIVVKKGEIHAFMGPNGSGKSTLANALSGHPDYTITDGRILLDGNDITTLSPEKRAHAGLFLAFQYPHAIPGVKLGTFLKHAINSRRRKQTPPLPSLKIREFREMLTTAMDYLQMPETFTDRYLNDGFSGGEKKKTEILQMTLLRPQFAILDETDSGLDVDALRIVCEGVQTLRAETQMGVLLITHYPRILQYLQPDHVHVMHNGHIIKSGGPDLASTIEREGYTWLTAKRQNEFQS